MYHRRPLVDYDAAYIEVMPGEDAIRIVTGRREGMHAVLYTFTGYVGYDKLCSGVWEALDNRSKVKAEIAKNWLWHLLHDGVCTIENLQGCA